MKKQLLYVAALCSSFALCTASEEISPETFSLANLGATWEQAQMQAEFSRFLYAIREMQDLACSTKITLEQMKERIAKQLESFKNMSNDNTPEAYMLRQTHVILKEALKVIADATRKNMLPAVDAEICRNGVDAQATRLEVIEYIESLLQ